MTNPNHFRIIGTIKKARARLQSLDPHLTTYDQLRVIEERNIERLQDLLAAPMNEDIIQDNFSQLI